MQTHLLEPRWVIIVALQHVQVVGDFLRFNPSEVATKLPVQLRRLSRQKPNNRPCSVWLLLFVEMRFRHDTISSFQYQTNKDEKTGFKSALS